MSTGKIVMGALAGFAVGAIAGILLAPDKGSKTRKHIKEMGEDYAKQLKSKLDEHVNSLTEKYSNIFHHAEDVVNKGKTKYEESKKDIKSLSADLKQVSS